MKRRLLLTALACCGPAARVLAQDDPPRPRHKISAAELHAALSARFPVRLGLAGLLELQVSAPRLLLLPPRNQLGASLVVQASGPALQAVPPGEMDLMFGLRYEAADRTLRADHLEVRDLRLPGAPPETLQAMRAMLPKLARDVVGDIVLHKFSPRELALADTMGFEPEQVKVVEDGLVVLFAPKRMP
jgi:hypothetical protein